MSWSTRELAEMAGTTLRAVRHYHSIGLLPDPPRSPNGYKAYGVQHLLRVLRIRRLVDVGFSLAEIASFPDDGIDLADELRRLDTEVAEKIEELRSTRANIAALLSDTSDPLRVADVEARVLGPSADHLTEADRSYLLAMSRVVSPEIMEQWTAMVESTAGDETLADFDRLPEDADESAREDMARRLAAHLKKIQDEHPGLRDVTAGAPLGADSTLRTVALAKGQLYNEAQADVLERVGKAVTGY
ncbi:MAG: MerR family transcriptional regulator [Mycobacteriaceae bacterium]|uniref:MerR family transcriptional regulator n=1 Tax=Corynebacterium sp. TaxID=1720 RepID=UPI003F9D00AA